jgi:predicted dehydrogenase
MLRVALAGPGRFGMELGRLLRDTPGAELVAVYSHTPATAKTAAEALGVPASTSFEDVVGSDSLDAVVIATSHDTHRALTIDAARAGKHVFCEKPMAITVADCEAMIRATDEAGVRLFVGHSMRYHPLVVRARSAIDEGLLGSPLAVTMMRFATQIRLGWWSRQASYGGMLHSPGIHELDLMNSLLGRPRIVYAQAAPRVQPQVDYDDTIFVQVKYESGAIGSLTSSISDPLNDPGGRESTRILCERGGIGLEFGPTSWLEVQRRGETPERTSNDDDGWESIRSELRNFVQWISGDAEPLIYPIEALAAVEVCEAAYASVATGAPVTLPIAARTRGASIR